MNSVESAEKKRSNTAGGGAAVNCPIRAARAVPRRFFRSAHGRAPFLFRRGRTIDHIRDQLPVSIQLYQNGRLRCSPDPPFFQYFKKFFPVRFFFFFLRARPRPSITNLDLPYLFFPILTYTTLRRQTVNKPEPKRIQNGYGPGTCRGAVFWLKFQFIAAQVTSDQ